MSITFSSINFGGLPYINSVLMSARANVFSITSTSVIWTTTLTSFYNYYYKYTINTNTKTLNGTPTPYVDTTLGDDTNAYLWYANYPGPGRGPMTLFSCPYIGGSYQIYLTDGAFQNNNIAIYAFVGKTFLIYWTNTNGGGKQFLVVNKTLSNYPYGGINPTGTILACSDTNLLIGNGTIINQTPIIPVYTNNIITSYTFGTTVGINIPFNIINLVYVYTNNLLYCFTSNYLYIIGLNDNGLLVIKYVLPYPNNITVTLGTAPAQLASNSLNLSYVFVVDNNNKLYQLVLYFDIFKNTYYFYSICNIINLTTLSITGVYIIQVGITGQYLGVYNGTMYIFQFSLPTGLSSIENAVVW